MVADGPSVAYRSILGMTEPRDLSGPTWFPCLSAHGGRLTLPRGVAALDAETRRCRWSIESQGARALSRQNLDLAIEARLHLEVAVVDPAFTARDGDVVALLEHDPGKYADRFLDDVSARGENRPRGIRKGLATLLANQLEGDHGGAVMDRHVGQLTGLNANIGAHHGIAVAIVGDDIIDTFG